MMLLYHAGAAAPGFRRSASRVPRRLDGVAERVGAKMHEQATRAAVRGRSAAGTAATSNSTGIV